METFKNKRILFICRETYSKPLWFLAKEYSKENAVGAFYIMSTESCYNKCKYNENTIFQFREKLPQVKFYDVSDICKKFTEDLKSKPKKRSTSKHPWKNYKSPVNLEYLKEIEENYTHFKNLNLQLMSSQENTKHYHWRYYWQVQDFDENLYWLELNYRKIISVIEDFKPDMILDFDNAELQRTIINEVAYKKNIPYITIEYSKFGFYKFPTLQNTIGIDDYVKERYEENFKKTPEELSEMYDYVRNFRTQSSIMSKEFAGTVTSKYERDSVKSILKEMLAKYIYFYDEDIRANNKPVKKSDKRLFPDTHLNIKHFWQVQLLRRKFMGLNDVFENPVEGEDYVYMPLHLIPESTVFIKGSFFVDELNLIEQVSKALPIGWKLYVKEHQAMLGERGVEFYEKVRELHNVRLVQINYYHDPKPWINNAKGVVTIVGTTAYEEALFGKRSIIFGDVPFNLIDGVEKITDFSKLPEAIRQFGEIDNIHSCAAYLQTIKDVGFEWDLFYVMDKADKILGGKEEMDEKFSSNLATINEFYKAGYRHFEEKRGK